MLVTFRSKNSANITLFGDIAIRLLKIMGHSGTVPGAILAKDVPEALERLQQGIEKETPAAKAKENNADDETVSLAHRALPLIELLSFASKEKNDVMWEEGSG
jgi:hypothetical protein